MMAGELFDMDYLWYGNAISDTLLRECRECGGNERCVYCSGLGYDLDDMGQLCDQCGGDGLCPNCDGEGEEPYEREDCDE